MTETQAAAYLAALIDGEGHIRVHKNRSASVSNTEWDLIEATVECCELLGLKYRIVPITRPNPAWKDGWEVLIYGKSSMEKIRDKVPLRSSRKMAAVEEAISLYKYREERPAREWLIQKYHTEGLSLQKVAEAAGAKNSVSAHCWLSYYGIPRRTQAEGQRKYPLPSEEWLRQKYEVEGLSLAAIAQLRDVPHASYVHGWMRHYGIPTRGNRGRPR